ncbi:MAG: hypothetical protein J1F64_04885 [Oscillospiraceae bacterium]|nr:hypothetical protein [Oscillospiraceae bacterium]
MGSINGLLPDSLFSDKEKYDAVLDKLFYAIIEAGIISYSMACHYDPTLTASNYLKKDKNYYNIIEAHLSTILEKINDIFNSI